MVRIDLKQLRADRGGLTQTQLADMLGCKQPYIAQIERGIRTISDEMLEIVKEQFGNISAYITEEPEGTVIQNNRNGDNINGDKKIFFGSSEEKDAEIVRLTSKLEAAQDEIMWLRSMVEKLSSK